jgi:hypothetical protein
VWKNLNKTLDYYADAPWRICDNEWNNLNKTVQMFPEGTATTGGAILIEHFNMQMFPGGPVTMSGTQNSEGINNNKTVE